MEEAVPREQPVELPVECELAHVRDDPLGAREALAAQGDQRRRRIDPDHSDAGLHTVARDRLAHAAADVQDLTARPNECQKTVEPVLLRERARAIVIVIPGMTLVQVYHRLVAHRASTAADGRGRARARAIAVAMRPASRPISRSMPVGETRYPQK